MVSITTSNSDFTKQIFNCQHHHTRALHCTKHCISLSGSGGTITENWPIPPLQNCFHKFWSSENVKSMYLSMKHKWLPQHKTLNARWTLSTQRLYNAIKPFSLVLISKYYKSRITSKLHWTWSSTSNNIDITSSIIPPQTTYFLRPNHYQAKQLSMW